MFRIVSFKHIEFFRRIRKINIDIRVFIKSMCNSPHTEQRTHTKNVMLLNEEAGHLSLIEDMKLEGRIN